MQSRKVSILIAAFLTVVGLGNTPASAAQFAEQLLSGSYTYAYGLAAGDLDGDGKLDIVSSDANSRSMYWYHNDGKGKFTRKVIESHDKGILERMAIGDLNGDGRPDVAVINNQIGFPHPADRMHGEIYWYENPASGPWIKHVISNYYGRAYDVALADFNKDGKLDVVASSYTGNQIAWFENPGNNNIWTEHKIATNIGETRTARVADFNGDGTMDVLTTSRTAGQVIWYENDGKGTFTSHLIDDKLPGASHGEAVDMDGDGDKDIVMAAGFNVPASQGKVVWYENDGKGSFTKHLVSDFPNGIEAVAGDLDGDGRVDIAAIAFTYDPVPSESVVWFKNEGHGTWTKHVLKQNWFGADTIILCDVNADGRLDIFAAAESTTNEVRWWRNDGGGKLTAMTGEK